MTDTTTPAVSRLIVILWLLAVLGALSATAVQAASNRLESVDALAGGDGGVTIRLIMSGAAPAPAVFTVNEPARLSIDLPDTALAVAERHQRIDQGVVQVVSMAAGDTRTRVVVQLAEMVRYDIERAGNELRVHIGGTAPEQQTAAPATPQTTGRTTNSVSTGPAHAIDAIDFRRGEQGAGRIKIQLDGVNAPVEVNDEGNTIVARLPGIVLPDRLQKRLDVLDFATPIKTIDALARNDGTRIVITPTTGSDYEQIAYQTGDEFFIELQPLTPTERAQRERETPSYNGERISLSFQNIDVRAVLQIIADVADVNMVVADSVSGTMALRLEDVPWDQALDIILESKSLGMRRENNVITVALLTEIAAREQAELAAEQATTNLAPLQSEIFQINYARASDLASLLRNTDGELSLLTERGQVTVDERTNSLLVNETQAKLDEIRHLINRLDIPVRQVLIESRIVIANREFSRNLGLQAGVRDPGANELPDGTITGDITDAGGFSVNLPAADPAGTFATTLIGSSFNLNLALSALESENRGEVISSPRVITANGQEAQIEQGREIPYQEGGTGDQPATIEFKKAVLNLTVTPKITPDEKVIMSLNIKQDEVGEFVPTQTGGLVPSIDTRSLVTQVLVDDGETVVLGGVFEQTNRDRKDQVPILGDLPLIGGLFRGTSEQHDKRELLLFITPKILRETLSAR